MTITLPRGLPAADILRREGFAVDDPGRARSADPLRIGLVNLMPRKEATELALARLLAESGHPVELTLVLPATYTPRNTPPDHVAGFYRRWPDVRDEPFDALIVTGAPVEMLPFEEVSYWRELRDMILWARTHVRSSLYICWAAQAALYALREIPKSSLPQKAFGVFDQDVVAPTPLLRGMGPRFPTPVSRHSEVRREHLERAGLAILAASSETGPSIVEDRENRAICIFDHLEYADDTLLQEYHRDRLAGLPIAAPRNLGTGRVWHPCAALFFRNWLDSVAAERAAGERERPTRHAAVRGRSAGGKVQVLFQSSNRPHLLSETLVTLASQGIHPSAARARISGGLTTVDMVLEGLSPSTAEDVSRSLLRLPGARRVLVRLANGSGGVVRPRSYRARAA